MLSLMPYTDADRRRLADIVRRERIDKKLDKEPAARAAGVSSITWKRVEDAEGVRDASLSKILTSLGLTDADSLLAGGEAHPQIRKANYEPAPFPYDRAAFVQELTDIWEAWRDLGLRLVASPDPDLSRQARRGLSLTATVLLNLLTLAGRADSSALRADLTEVMFKVFKPEENEGATHADQSSTDTDPSAEPATSPEGDEDEEAKLTDDAQRGSNRTMDDTFSSFGGSPGSGTVSDGEHVGDVADGQ